MSVTYLDTTAALIAVDLQDATVSMPSALDMALVIENAAQLAVSFREHGRPVVLTQAELNNPPGGRTAVSDRQRPRVPAPDLQLVPEVGRAADDVVVSKRGWSAFVGTGLDARLRDLRTTQVVLIGLATNYGIESTARQAYDLGYSVVIVSDAINNPNLEGHQHALTRVLPALAQIATTAEILAELAYSD